MMIEIENDVFNIANRIREIDFNYIIFFNLEKHKYEIHYKGRSDSYVLTLPFDELDERTVDYVNKTRVENIENLIREIDAENEKRGAYEM